MVRAFAHGAMGRRIDPVYGGHSWDLTKVAAIERWPPYAGHMKVRIFKNNYMYVAIELLRSHIHVQKRN